jgi:[ribosomal protein S5]-alanine N-acetyltransferase
MQPTFTTSRLVLRPAEPADLDTLWALWTDAAVRRFLWDDRVIDRDDAAATLADCLALSAEGLGLWLIQGREAQGTDDTPNVSLGCAGLLPVSSAATYEPRLASLVEPLVALTPGVWGRGYAQEALAALVSHAHTTLGLPRLAAVTDVPNVASDRMLRRAGFTVLSEQPGPRFPLRTYLREASTHHTAQP